MTEPTNPDKESNSVQREQPEGVAPQTADATNTAGLFGVFGSSIAKSLRWVIGLIVGAVGVALFANPVSSAIENRCTSFPIAYEFIRETTCASPVQFPIQDFVIVALKLVGDETVSTSTVQSVSISIDAELERSQIPAYLGTLHVVPSIDPWVDAVPDFDSLKNEAREQAELRNADIVIYGKVLQGTNIIFEPAFYVHNPIPQEITSLLEAIDPENLGVQFLILEGQSLQVSEWLQGIRAFAIGLQSTRQSMQLATVADSSLESRIIALETALQSFQSVSEKLDSRFYAITNLNAGNTALQIAVLKQEAFEQDPENGCVPRCLDYDIDIVENYLVAWDHYTVAVSNKDDDLSIRGLIGRGNVQYRLSRITRTGEFDNVDFINYNCASDDNLYIEENGQLISDANWIQRALASEDCFEQVIYLTNDESIIHVKGLFGVAQTLDWLGEETDDVSASTSAFDAYSQIIEQYENVAPNKENPELTCLTGYAYGQRAFIRWNSGNDIINNIDERKKDFSSAIAVLESAPSKCMASETIREYQTYID